MDCIGDCLRTSLGSLLLPELVGVVHSFLLFRFKLIASWRIPNMERHDLDSFAAAPDGEHIVVTSSKYVDQFRPVRTTFDLQGNVVNDSGHYVAWMQLLSCVHRGQLFSLDRGSHEMTVHNMGGPVPAVRNCTWMAKFPDSENFVPRCIAVHPDGTVFVSFFGTQQQTRSVARFSSTGDLLQLLDVEDRQAGHMVILPTGKLVTVHSWKPIIHVYE